MKDFRFYAELCETRGSKAASKGYNAFNREWLSRVVEQGLHVNCMAVLLDRGRPFWIAQSDRMDCISSVNGRGNAAVEHGIVDVGYLRKRCVRVSEDLARKLHPALFDYLEPPVRRVVQHHPNLQQIPKEQK